MADYSAGSASVTIKPDLSKFATLLKSELQRVQVTHGVEIDADVSGFTADLKAKLAAVEADKTIDVNANTAAAETKIHAMSNDKRVQVNVDADTKAASVKITEAARDRRSTIHTDANTTTALTALTLAARDRMARIVANADTKAATTRLALLSRTRVAGVKVNADTAGAMAKIMLVARPRIARITATLNAAPAIAALASLRAATASVGGALMRVGGMAMLVGGIGTAALGAIGPLSALVGAIMTVGNALATLPAIAGAAMAGIAAIGIGLGGIGNAFRSMGQAGQSGGAAAAGGMDTAAQAAKQAEQNARNLERAQRGVRDAERNLEQAQKSAKRAQDSLNEARKNATKELEDLNEQLRDAALDEEGAVLAVARAKQQLDEAMSDDSSTRLDIAEADLNYRKAVESLDDMRRANNELAETTAEANAKGVEGSEQVVQAKEAVEDADYRVLTSTEALADAQRDLADAQKAMAEGMGDVGGAAGGAAGGIDAFSEALSKLSPNAREFVLAMQALGPAWNDMKLAVQDSLFAGLGADITTLANVQLPVMKQGLSGVADAINSGLRTAIREFSSEKAALDFADVLENTRVGFSNLAGAAGPLSHIWQDLNVVGSQFLPRLGAAIASVTGEWARNISVARENGSLAAAIERGIDAWHRFKEAMSDVWGVLSGFFGAASEAGIPFLGVMGAAVKEMHRFVDSAQGHEQLVSMFTSASNAVGALMPVLGGLANIFATQIVPFFEKLAQNAGPGLSNAMQSLGGSLQTLQPVAAPLGQFIGALAEAFAKVAETLAPLIAAVLPPLLSALTALAPVIAVVASVISPVVMAFRILSPIIGVVSGAMQMLSPVINMITGVFRVLQPILGFVFRHFGLIRAAIAALTGPVGIIIGVFTVVAGLFVTLYKNNETFRNGVNRVVTFIKTLFVIAWNMFIDRLKAAWNTLKDGIQWVQNIRARFGDFVDYAKRKASEFIEGIKEIPTKIRNAFRNAGDWLRSAGGQIVDGLRNGVSSAWDSFTGWFKNKLNSIPGVGNAIGSIVGGFSDGAVTQYANGAVTAMADGRASVPVKKSKQDAQIQPGGSWVVWAEDETQGESFIPHAKSKRKRSTQILKKTAEIFGYDLVDQKTGLTPPTYNTDLSPVPGAIKAYAQGVVTVQDMDNKARGVHGVGYVMGGPGWGDCSQTQSIMARYATTGEFKFARAFSTVNEGQVLAQMGFTSGLGPRGSYNIGWWDQGGGANGHTAGTLPSGVNLEMGGSNGGQFGGRAIGASDPSFTHHAHLPPSWFKKIEIPRMSGLNFKDTGDAIRATGVGESGDDLANFRDSEASDPSSYVGDGSTSGDTYNAPSTWGDIAARELTGIKSTKTTSGDNSKPNDPKTWADAIGTVALETVKGFTDDAFEALGLQTELPPAIKAFDELAWKLNKADKATTAKAADSAINDISKSADKANDAAAKAGVVTEKDTVSGMQLADIKAPKVEMGSGNIGVVYNPSGGAEQWRPVASEALRRHGYNDGDLRRTIDQIKIESGGNPNIVNTTDSNARKGTPSGGLLQVIKPTFDWMRSLFPNEFRNTANNHFDPLANLVAGVAWARHKYGGPSKVWPTRAGYATGGDVWGRGGSTDDLIPALLSNGEHVTRTASADVARPLLNAINTSPNFAKGLNDALMGGNRAAATSNTGTQYEVHYHIETNELDEGLRRADLHSRQQALAIAGA